VQDRRTKIADSKNGIDRRKHDEDYAERIVGGARIDRSRRSQADDKPRQDSSASTSRKP
jgi:hypothetical protein